MGSERAPAILGEREHFLLGEEERVGRETVPDMRQHPSPGSSPAPLPALARANVSWQALTTGFREELSKEGARGAAFLCLPVLMGGGAALYFALPAEPGPVPLGLAVGLLTIFLYLARTQSATALAVGALLVLTLGMGVAKLQTWRAATPMLGSEVTTRISGRLVGLEHQASGRVRLMIDVERTERPRLSYAPERVRLTARAAPEGLRPGDGVSGLVRLMPPSGPVRPGAYDFSFNSYFDGFGAVGFFMSGPDRVELEEPLPASARPARWLEGLRVALANRIRSRIGGAEGEVAVAMIAGFRPGIPEEINEWLRRSGLAHILSISGLHMALVAATIMWTLRAGAALFPAISSRVPVKKYAAGAALAMCTLYLFISGADVAARRSYIMLAVMLAALLFDRAALTMRNVAIAALIIIVWSPHEVIGPSFQMSFAATAALVAGYAAWNGWRRSRPRRGVPPANSLPGRVMRAGVFFVVGLAVTSVIAGTATALYGIWHFQRATPLALPANLAAMPLVSIFVMPAAVLAMLAMPLGLDGFFLKIMGHGIAAVVSVAEWFSDRSPFDAVGLIPLPAFLALTAALVIAVLSISRLKLLALPCILAGVAFLMTRQMPDVLVTEDARLVGVRLSEGIAVNRNRPNGFTMADWTRALKAETVLKPQKSTKPSVSEIPAGAGFSCGQDLCLARHESGAVIAHAATIEAGREACSFATLLVLENATVEDLCPGAAATVVTKRDLARKGSVSAFLDHSLDGQMHVAIRFSIEEPWRPWHMHRAWSRPARGMPPYRREEKSKGEQKEEIASRSRS